MIEKPKRLTIQQAAEWLEMKVSTLRTRIQERKIKVIADGNRYLITEAEVLRYNQAREDFTG